jgi:hypothetical protein
MDDLMGIMDSEYNNVGDLMGLDDQMMGEINELMGDLGAVQKVKLMQKLFSRPMASRGSRAEFEKYFRDVPDYVKKDLDAGKLRLADFTVYSVKQVSSKTIKLFESQDTKEQNLRNVSAGKLEKSMVMIVSGIYLLAGTTSDDTNKDLIKAIDYKSLSNFPALANGEWYLKSNKTQITPEGHSNRKFITDNNHYLPTGFYKLDNPRVIKDDEPIEFNVELGTMQGLDPKTFLYVALTGTVTTP